MKVYKNKYKQVLKELMMRFNDMYSDDIYYNDCNTCFYSGFTVDCGDMGEFCYKCLEIDNKATYDILNNKISSYYK